jgi:hypothetical protein
MSYRIPSTSPDINAEGAGAVANFDKAFGVEHDTASGAIGIKEGLVSIDGTSALAMTLAAPASGLQSAGGDDGRLLRILSTTAFAHTVTTPANAIAPSHHVITFSAAAGEWIELVADGGLWYPLAQSTTNPAIS